MTLAQFVTLAQFEALDSALTTHLLAPSPRSQSRLFDLCLSMGMAFDSDETEWAAERVFQYLRAA
jgi:hypothetical protein